MLLLSCLFDEGTPRRMSSRAPRIWCARGRKAKAENMDLRGLGGMAGVEDMAADAFTEGKHLKR